MFDLFPDWVLPVAFILTFFDWLLHCDNRGGKDE